MAKVKLELRYLTVPDRIEFGRQTITSMTGNAHFTTPEPALTALTEAVNELETAFNNANTARQAAITQTSILADKTSVFDTLFTKLGNYVENASGGDEATILSSGLSVRSKATPVGSMSAPQGLSLTAGDKEGQLDGGWDPVRGAKTYIAEVCLDPITPTGWKSAGVTTKSSITITGLVSGSKYWVRVAAIGAAGQGPWSDPATKIAP
jgi:hypothetical protein